MSGNFRLSGAKDKIFFESKQEIVLKTTNEVQTKDSNEDLMLKGTLTNKKPFNFTAAKVCYGLIEP